MAKFLKTAAIVVGAVALVATGIGVIAAPSAAAAAAGSAGGILSVSAATFTSIGAFASIGAAALSVGAQLLAPKFQSEGSPLSMDADTNSGLPIWIGRTAFAGRQIARVTANSATWPKDDLLFFAVLLSCTSLSGIERFTADNVQIDFNASTGQATTIGYNSWMSQKVALGESPQPAALSLSLNGTGFGAWTSAHKLSGMAHALWGLRYDTNGDHYQNGVPKPQWIGTADGVYDPRLDSTYPGGSGSNRIDDPATWTGDPSNPGLYALFWALGHFQNGIKVCGIGAPPETIRIADFVECANVCEANAWRVGGIEWTTAPKWDTFSRILQAGGAVPTKAGAMIGCRVMTPRTSLVTIPGRDWLEDLDYPANKPRRDRFNTALPRFVSESHGWDVITGSEISVPDFVTEDRGRRSKGIDMPLVQAEDGISGFDGNLQAGQLASYAICNSREAGPIEFTTGLKYIGVYTGDCVTLDAPDEGFDAVKVTITGRSVDIATARIRFTAETETDGKHAFALGTSTTPPDPPSLTPPPPAVSVPDAGDWNVAPVSIADGQAGLHIEGNIADPVADAVLIEYSVHGIGAWKRAGVLSGSGTLSLDIGPLDSAQSWDVRIAYAARGRTGDWLEIGSVLTGSNALAVLIANGARSGSSFPAASDSAEGQLFVRTDLGNRLFQRIAGDGTLRVGDGQVLVAASGGGTEPVYLPPWIEITDQRMIQALADAALAYDAAVIAQQLASDAQATADGKIRTFYQTSAPTAESVGDIWFDTDDGNKQYRWSGSSWDAAQDTAIGTAITAAAGAQATADGKVTTFYQTGAPTAEGVGDLWVDTDDANKLYRWSGSAWVSVRDGRVASGLNDDGTVANDKVGIPALKDGTTGTFQSMTTNYGGAKSVAASTISTFGPFNVATSNADGHQILRCKLSVNVGAPSGAITNPATAMLYLKYYDGSSWHTITSCSAVAFSASLQIGSIDKTAYGDEIPVTWSGAVTYGLFLELSGGDGGAQSTQATCLLDVITRK